MSDTFFNDAPQMGDNATPELEADAAALTEQLKRDYEAHLETARRYAEEAKGLPETITSEDDLGKTGLVIKKIRDHRNTLLAIHKQESAPHLRRWQEVNQFFFRVIDYLGKRDKKARDSKPGLLDVLQARVDDYTARKVAAERMKREEEARVAAKALREKQEAEQRARDEAEAARLAAERARTPHTTEAKQEVANVAQNVAEAARVDTLMAADKVEQTTTAQFARSADIARARLDDGVLATAKQEPYAIVTDEAALDMAKLWPFIKLEWKEQALRAWAKQTGHKVMMTGASIGFRDKGQIR